MVLVAPPLSEPQPNWLRGAPGALAGSAAAGELSLSIVATRSGFDALESDWNALFAQCARGAAVYQSFNWNWHWANAYLSQGDCDLAILAVRRQERLVALWPMVVTRLLGARVVEWMGSPVSQYGDVLIAPGEDRLQSLAFGWAAIRNMLGADAVHLRKVRADAEIVPLMQQQRVAVTFRTEAPFLDIASAPDLATYETRFSSKTRKNRRRLARRLAEKGELRIERLENGSSASAAAKDAVALRHRTLIETGRVSIALQSQRYADFFAQATSGERSCGCRVTRILVGDRLAAAAIDVSAHGHRAAHLIVHDHTLDACGPGVTTIGDWMQAAFDDRIGVLDLLAPAHAYKWDWADSSVDVCDYAVATSTKGHMVVVPYLAKVRPRLKAAVERLARWRAGRSARGDRTGLGKD